MHAQNSLQHRIREKGTTGISPNRGRHKHGVLLSLYTNQKPTHYFESSPPLICDEELMLHSFHHSATVDSIGRIWSRMDDTSSSSGRDLSGFSQRRQIGLSIGLLSDLRDMNQCPLVSFQNSRSRGQSWEDPGPGHPKVLELSVPYFRRPGVNTTPHIGATM